MKQAYSTKELVALVRKDPYLGKGTCSFIDETQTDKELGSLIKEEIHRLHKAGKVVTKGNILSAMTSLENLWRDVDDSGAFKQIDRRDL